MNANLSFLMSTGVGSLDVSTARMTNNILLTVTDPLQRSQVFELTVEEARLLSDVLRDMSRQLRE